MSVFGMCRQTGKGPYRHQTAKWKGGVAVAMGDFVFADAGDSNYDKPISSLTWNTNEATTRVDLQPVFRGIADVRRTTAQTADGTEVTDGPILCSGEFTYPCAALGSAAKPGDLVGPEKASGNALENQKVQVVSAANEAIGKVTRHAAVGATELTFELYPETFIATPIV